MSREAAPALDPEAVVGPVTFAVREADAQFARESGRHWVRDCFLPALEREGLAIVRK